MRRPSVSDRLFRTSSSQARTPPTPRPPGRRAVGGGIEPHLPSAPGASASAGGGLAAGRRAHRRSGLRRLPVEVDGADTGVLERPRDLIDRTIGRVEEAESRPREEELSCRRRRGDR